MTRSIPRRAVVGATIVVALAALSAASSAVAAPTPEVRALQRQVKTLRTQVASLRSELNSLKATVREVASTAQAANAAATTAGQNASTAVTKTNCIVNATALVLWNNDVYVEPPNTLFMGTGLDIAEASDSVSGYVAGVSPSCVPSVLPRAGRSAMRAFAALSAGAVRSPH